MEERTIRDILESIGRTEKLVAENVKGLEELRESSRRLDEQLGGMANSNGAFQRRAIFSTPWETQCSLAVSTTTKLFPISKRRKRILRDN